MLAHIFTACLMFSVLIKWF